MEDFKDVLSSCLSCWSRVSNRFFREVIVTPLCLLIVCGINLKKLVSAVILINRTLFSKLPSREQKELK